MSYYTPSTPAIERSPPVPGNTPTIVCLSCGDVMDLVRIIPKLGVRREKLIFVALPAKGSIQRKWDQPILPYGSTKPRRSTKPSKIRTVNSQEKAARTGTTKVRSRSPAQVVIR